ncbi:MAG TPA: hypothetical protein PLY69_06930 [Bacteroidales bacterium]|nr:hypothetical protein [Bacteroidales bacterium]HQJ76413.1 hypothetical protein [Bacteroidota bacterium]
MKRSDFKCSDCLYTWEIMVKSFLEDFPKTPECPVCKSTNTSRLYSIVTTDVAEGLAGNFESGYSKGIVYHPSKFGKFKGKKIK